MSWLQVSVNATKQSTSSVESILIDAGALSLTLKDAADGPMLEPAIKTKNTYAQYFEMDDIKIKGDWVLLHGRKIN